VDLLAERGDVLVGDGGDVRVPLQRRSRVMAQVRELLPCR
jgi:hypothetical protein